MPSFVRRSLLAALLRLAALLPLVVLVPGCGPAAGAGGRAADGSTTGLPIHDGPVVLLTLGSLRADALEPRLMPNLQALAAEADWAGRAVAPSSWALPSLASVLTGLPPWSHGVLGAPFSALAPELVTLPEALAEHGYTASAYVSTPWFRPQEDWGQGFTYTQALRGAGRATGHLASLGQPGTQQRQFLWIDLAEPAAPYLRHDDLLDRLGPLPDGLEERLPRRLEAEVLERWADPADPVPPERRRFLTALYRLNVAHADRRLGGLLDALRRSPAWEDTLLVVTSLNGEDLGEHHGTGSGTTLARELVEVPLVVKLPAALRSGPRSGGARRGAPLPVPADRLVALTRVWPTLVAAVGGNPPPAVGPSLFDPLTPPVLSELYLENGYNELSLVEEADGVVWQLLWRRRFAPAEPAFHLARRADLGVPVPELEEPPLAVFRRLTGAFRTSLPLGAAGAGGGAGEGGPQLTLLRWRGAGEAREAFAGRAAVEVVEDPERTAAMAAALHRRWLAFQGCERTPRAERAWREARRGAAP